MVKDPPVRQQNRNLLKTSRYDEASSLLISLLILVGIVVAVLLLFWLTFSIFRTTVAIPVEFANLSDDSSMDDGIQLDQPMADQLGIVDAEEPLQESTLEAISDAVTMMENVRLTSDVQGKGGSTGRGSGTGGRQWELSFDQGNTLNTYARQLDFFGIEMAVPEKGDELTYVTGFSSSSPSVRRGKTTDEKRSYLTWTKGGLQAADVELLSHAGVKASGKLILKFLPTKTEQAMLKLETNHAGDRAPRIRATTFGIKTAPGGYEFFIMKQTYRN